MRLIEQLLTESVLLATISGGVGLIVVVGLKSFLLQLAPADLPRLNETGLNTGVLFFALVISILTGLLFGLAPALQTARRSHVSSLRESSQGSGSSRGQTRISRVLVASEIALSLILLVGAGLLLRSFWQLLEVRPGFEPHQLMTARMWLSFPNDPAKDQYRENEKRAAFQQEVLRRVSRLPGVQEAAVGGMNSLPMSSARNQVSFVIEGRATESERAPVAEGSGVSPEYFHVLRTPLVRGRVFTDADDSKGQLVALVDETLARRYWPGEDPIGKHIRFGAAQVQTQAQNPWLTIVGIVGDIKSDGFDRASAPHIYVSTYQSPSYAQAIYLRTNGDPKSLEEAIRHEVQAVDPTIPVFGVRRMDEIVAKNLAERRFALQLLGVFAGVALLLASIGIYGVMAYTFSRRTNEIGIRIAMGAQRRDILRIALEEGALIVALGVISGLAGSFLLTRFLQSMLFDVKPTDPITFTAITALLAGVGLLACLIPARKATRVDPLVALRHE
jgi:predicted permease